MVSQQLWPVSWKAAELPLRMASSSCGTQYGSESGNLSRVVNKVYGAPAFIGQGIEYKEFIMQL